MILILGTTASGKSRLAFELAGQTAAEIISIDSMKVYRRMDIGTAKPTKQMRRQVKYHLLDVVEPSESFSVAAFLDLACKAIDRLKERNKPVIAVGGTALYIKTLLYGLFEGPAGDQQIRDKLRRQAETEGSKTLYDKLMKIDPLAADRIAPNDVKRIIRAMEVYEITGKPISGFQTQFDAEKPAHNWTIIGLRRQKADSGSRINKRVKKMIEVGLIDEVKSLLAEPEPLSKQARCAIGYAEIIDYLNAKTSLEDAIELIKKNSRRLAKSQRTWFKTFRNVNWLDVEPPESAEQILSRAKKILENARP